MLKTAEHIEQDFVKSSCVCTSGFTILLLSVLLLLTACVGSGERRRMEQVLAEADSMNRAYADLSSSDSILTIAAQFYDRHGTANERVRAHYLLGCAYRDRKEAPQALECYQQAIEAADTTASDCDFRLLMSISGQMADLFHAQNLPQEELVCWNNYSYYAKKTGNDSEYIRGIEISMRPYFLMKDTGMVIKIINETHRRYLEMGDSSMSVSSYGTLIYIHVCRRQFSEARLLMNAYENMSGFFDKNGNIVVPDRQFYYYIKGDYYLKRLEVDSAEFFIRKLPVSLYARDRYRGLLSVYKERQNADSVFKYSQLYEDATDSLNNSMRTDVLHRMNSLYDYHRYRIKAANEEAAATRTRWLLFFSSVLFLIILSYAYYCYRRQKLKKEAEHEEYVKNLMLLDEKQKEIDILKKHKEDNIYLIDRKEKEISELKERIRVHEQKTYAEYPVLNVQIQSCSEVVRFRQLADRGLQPQEPEWQSLYAAINSVLPQFSEFMDSHRFHLNDAEYKICYLICAHVNNKGMASLLGVSPSYVNKLRKNMLRQMFNLTDSASVFDRKILETAGLKRG